MALKNLIESEYKRLAIYILNLKYICVLWMHSPCLEMFGGELEGLLSVLILCRDTEARPAAECKPAGKLKPLSLLPTMPRPALKVADCMT